MQVGPMPVLYYDLDRVDRATRPSVETVAARFRNVPQVWLSAFLDKN